MLTASLSLRFLGITGGTRPLNSGLSPCAGLKGLVLSFATAWSYREDESGEAGTAPLIGCLAHSATVWEPLSAFLQSRENSPSLGAARSLLHRSRLLYLISEGGSLLLPPSVVTVVVFPNCEPPKPLL